MSRYQPKSHYYPRGFHNSYKPISDKVILPLSQFHPTYHKSKIRYVQKYKQVIKEEPETEEVQITAKVHSDELKEDLSQEMEGIIKELIEKKLNENDIESSLDNSQQALEEKSDNETLIPEEEFTDTPTLFEIELLTKEGVKKIEFKQNDEPAEVAGRIAQENKLLKNVELAMQYKIRKLLSQLKNQC